jgi:hypothetical protein
MGLNFEYIPGQTPLEESDVWGWAGTFRKSNKNIGVDKTQIAVYLSNT